VTVDGKVFTTGDITSEVSIQSISKVFTMARVVEDQGADAIENNMGVDATGQVFNSIVAVEQYKGAEMNPMVNPGAITATSMVSGASRDEIWNKIIGTYSDFAGRALSVNQEVFKSEAETNQRNQAISMLMYAYGHIKDNPLQACDIYTEQCAVNVNAKDLLGKFDAVVLSGGAEQPRDLPIPGRDLAGIHFAMEFLPQQNRVVAGDKVPDQILATGKHVVVIGGGDTGSDCVGTSNRQGAASVTQFELMPQPPVEENKPLVWPNWPFKLRTSSSHEEGCSRDWAVATKNFIGENGKVRKLKAVRVDWKDGKMIEVPGSEFELKADLVLLAMGFLGPVPTGMLEQFGVEKDARSNVKADTEGAKAYATSVPKVFAAGDMRRGQSLVVWAIREGRQCARAVDEFLMGSSVLPR